MKKIEFANTLRGVAALCVLISHYFHAFWTRPDEIGALILAPALDVPVPAFVRAMPRVEVFSWGAFGVALFFLISGFVIPYSLKKVSLRGFLGNRIVRILPTYAVGFSITLAALWLSAAHQGSAWPFDTARVLWHYLPGLRDVMNVATIDGIIWTLDVEMKFYAVCAAAIVLFRRPSALVFGIPVALAVVAMTAWSWLARHPGRFDLDTVHLYHLAVNLIVASQFLVYMFVGVVFHHLHERALRPGPGAAWIALLVALFAAMLRFGPDAQGAILLPSYLWALLAFGLGYLARDRFAPSRIGGFLADVSYPLYVSHGVAGYVCMRALLEAGAGVAATLVTTTALALLLAWALHRLVEAPSHAVAVRLSRHRAERMEVKCC